MICNWFGFMKQVVFRARQKLVSPAISYMCNNIHTFPRVAVVAGTFEKDSILFNARDGSFTVSSAACTMEVPVYQIMAQKQQCVFSNHITASAQSAFEYAFCFRQSNTQLDNSMLSLAIPVLRAVRMSGWVL